MDSNFDRDTLERLVRLEASTYVKFVEIEKAINLAREGIDYRLNGMNEFQKRMDKLEGTFATKDNVHVLSKLVYVGLGIVLAVQLLIYAFIAYVKC